MVELPRRILVVEDEYLIACLIHDQLVEHFRKSAEKNFEINTTAIIVLY